MDSDAFSFATGILLSLIILVLATVCVARKRNRGVVEGVSVAPIRLYQCNNGLHRNDHVCTAVAESNEHRYSTLPKRALPRYARVLYRGD